MPFCRVILAAHMLNWPKGAVLTAENALYRGKTKMLWTRDVNSLLPNAWLCFVWVPEESLAWCLKSWINVVYLVIFVLFPLTGYMSKCPVCLSFKSILPLPHLNLFYLYLYYYYLWKHKFSWQSEKGLYLFIFIDRLIAAKIEKNLITLI